jgi:flagellar biosynthesis/type III secretory pathway protein FliH
MADAKHALEILSREPTAQQLAELRREAEVETRLERNANLKEGRRLGREEGRAQGRVEGRAELARETIERMCRSLGIALTAERVEQLEAWTEAELQAAIDWLFEHRSWPDHLPRGG